MRLKGLFYGTMVFAVFSFLTGCTHVRTYTVEKERVDQNLSSGNSGYLMGAPKEGEINTERRMTRTTYVAEVELGSAPSAKKGVVKQQKMSVETVQEPTSEPMKEEAVQSQGAAAGTAAKVSFYTVQNNDNLEKISAKVYGTSKKWKRIFEANKEQLKTPDKIYAGQVLKIPQE